VRPHYLLPLQPPPPTGCWGAGASFVVAFSISVPPAPDFSALHAVEAHPVTESPAPASKLAILRPANSFFSSFLSISTSSFTVNKNNALLQNKYKTIYIIKTAEKQPGPSKNHSQDLLGNFFRFFLWKSAMPKLT